MESAYPKPWAWKALALALGLALLPILMLALFFNYSVPRPACNEFSLPYPLLFKWLRHWGEFGLNPQVWLGILLIMGPWPVALTFAMGKRMASTWDSAKGLGLALSLALLQDLTLNATGTLNNRLLPPAGDLAVALACSLAIPCMGLLALRQTEQGLKVNGRAALKALGFGLGLAILSWGSPCNSLINISNSWKLNNELLFITSTSKTYSFNTNYWFRNPKSIYSSVNNVSQNIH